MTRSARAAALTPLLLALPGCDWVQDRFRTCGHVRVELVNGEQSLGPVAILAEHEAYFDEAVLASGASRGMQLCVERGDAKRFRTVRAGETVAEANCVVSRSRHELESTIFRVVWDPRGLVCENW